VRFVLRFADRGKLDLANIRGNPALAKRCKAVEKALGRMEVDLRHQSLNTHEFDDLSGPNDEKVWEAYAENATPGAYRIFFCYPGEKTLLTLPNCVQGVRYLLILAITPHP
jgi:hypothetical protein